MTTSYETIPQEEEPKKQNGGRKVAGALLAFAMAAGLVAAAAGRNRGTTLQENTITIRISSSTRTPARPSAARTSPWTVTSR